MDYVRIAGQGARVYRANPFYLMVLLGTVETAEEELLAVDTALAQTELFEDRTGEFRQAWAGAIDALERFSCVLSDSIGDVKFFEPIAD